MIKHHSGGLLGRDMLDWSIYYLEGRMLTPIVRVRYG